MRFLISLVFWACTFALVIGWFGFIHPAFDSFSHFRLHLAVLLSAGLLFSIRAKHRKRFVTGVAIVAFSLWLSTPHLPSLQQRPSSSGNELVRVAQFNLLFNNPNLEKAHTLLAKLDTDFVLLQEVTRHTVGVLSTLKTRYPFQHVCKYMGVAIVSHHPFAQDEKPVCASGLGFGTARFQIDDRQIVLGSIHLSWPWPRRQHQQINRLTGDLNALVTPLIIAGDFNAAPWSHTVQRTALMSKTKVAPGLAPSWAPRKLSNWTSLLGLPIDNTLYSRELQIVSRKALDHAGSDHLPVLTVFQWQN